jgi:hypothetical protein
VQRVRRTPGAPFRQVGDEIIVAVPGRDEFDVLTGSAIAVWSLLDVPRTVAELVRVLARRYRAAPGVVERDVRALLDRLGSTGTVEVG